MKVLYRHILLAMSLTAILQGCTDIYDETGNPDMEIALGSRLTSSSVSSKTAISTDYTGDPLAISYVRWDEGEDVFSAGTAVGNASMSGIPDAKNGWVRDIACKSPEYYRDRTSEVGFVGIYPSQDSWSGDISGGSLSGRTLSYTIDGETDVMVSGFAKGNYSTKVAPLTFRHALCQFRIYAYAVNAEIREEWGELTGVTFRNLPDAVDVTLPASIDEEPSFSYSGGPDQNGLTRTFDGGLAMPVEVPVPGTDAPCAVLLAGVPYGTSGDADNSLLGISVQTSNSSGENSVSIARNFRAGYTYNIFLRFSSVGIIDADVSVGEWEYGGEYEVEETFKLYSDLSRYGNANCYIVSSGNMGYSFDATVKGNGVNTLTSRTGETIQLPDLSTALSPAPADVRILKSDALMKLNVSTGNFEHVPVEDRTETPVIDKSSLTLSGGRVLFKVPGMDDKSDYRLTVKGNVLLGVYASETDDTPLWTWHIWVTDPPQNQGYLNGYVALDRNLGAVSSDPADFSAGESFCTGLYYQWGRKDPMMIRDGKLMNEVSGTPVQVAEAHRTPTVYYYDASGGNDWTTEDDGVKDHLWGYISAWDDIGKTMYDPCPPGYRVSGNPIWQDQSEAVGAEGLSDKGYYFTIGGTTRIYYPASKSIVGGEVRDSDSSVEEPSGSGYAYVYQLSATPYEEEMHDVSPEGSDALAYHFRYNIGVAGSMTNPNADYNAMVPDFTNTGEKYSTQRSSAYPVRCVFEDSAPVVNDLSASQTANCYVVQKTGFYSFKSNVRGNGTASVTVFTSTGGTEVLGIDGGDGASIPEVDHVDILWWQGDISKESGFSTFAGGDPSPGEIAEACPIIMMDGGQPDIDGNVMFYTRIDGEDDYGNVGLAAYNAVGDILWTWHIWLQPSVNVQTVGSYSMIDRNLGATYAPENESGDLTDGNVGATYGFYYQWGRKDPFFGNGTVWFEKENGQWKRWRGIKGTAPAGSISSSCASPLTFYTSSDGNRYWQDSMRPDENGDGAVNHLWGYTGSTSEGLAFVKTMWDPCPPGYRVMQYDVFMTARICYTEENSANRDGFRMDSYGSDDGYYQYGLMISPGDQSAGTSVDGFVPGPMTVGDNIWLPNTGYADSSDGGFRDMGNDGYLSTSTPMGGLTCREIWWGKDAVSVRTGFWPFYDYEYFYGVSQRNSSAYTANGRPVRCQME